MDVTKLLDDTRPIAHLVLDGTWYEAKNGQRIEVYPEPGNGAHVPWFAVYRYEWSDQPYARVNAQHVIAVVYAEKDRP